MKIRTFTALLCIIPMLLVFAAGTLLALGAGCSDQQAAQLLNDYQARNGLPITTVTTQPTTQPGTVQLNMADKAVLTIEAATHDPVVQQAAGGLPVWGDAILGVLSLLAGAYLRHKFGPKAADAGAGATAKP